MPEGSSSAKCGGGEGSDPQGLVLVEGGEDSQGRHLVAAEDIEAGAVVLDEYPLVAGPLYTRSKPVCLQCLKLVGDQSYRCRECSFPLCDESCQNGDWHANECKIIKDSGFILQIEDWSSFCPIYSCISVLRALLLRQNNPQGWKVMDSLMDHEEERTKKDAPTWKVHELMVVSFIQNSLNLTQFSHKDIRRVIGILRTNSVKLETRAGCGAGIAVYPTYSFANHSCLCNTHTKKFKDLRLQLIAQSPVKQGEEVWTRYTTPQVGNHQRTADIQRTWHFSCSCARCQDPTEFGTMMSGLICGDSCPGILLPLHSNILGSPWGCSLCRRKTGTLAVQKVVQAVIQDIGDNREKDNGLLIALIQKYSGSVLHPNHYLLLGIKEIILQRLMVVLNNKQIYARLCDQQKLETLTLRTQLFREIVEILVVVDSPGAPWALKLVQMEEQEQALKAQIKL